MTASRKPSLEQTLDQEIVGATTKLDEATLEEGSWQPVVASEEPTEEHTAEVKSAEDDTLKTFVDATDTAPVVTVTPVETIPVVSSNPHSVFASRPSSPAPAPAVEPEAPRPGM